MKEKLIKLYKQAEFKDPVALLVIEFLETYDGTNEEELDSLFTLLLMVLRDYEITEIKARGFDEMDDAKDKMDSKLARIKGDMSTLEKGDLPGFPMENTGVDESEVTE